MIMRYAINQTSSFQMKFFYRPVHYTEGEKNYEFLKSITLMSQTRFRTHLHRQAETLHSFLGFHCYTKPVCILEHPPTVHSCSNEPPPHPPRHHSHYTGCPVRIPRACLHSTLHSKKRPTLGEVT